MRVFKWSLCLSAFFAVFLMAQDEQEAHWKAVENGEITQEFEGYYPEDEVKNEDPSCIGDGCETPSEDTAQNQPTIQPDSTCAGENCEKTKLAENEEDEFCTPADSLHPDCMDLDLQEQSAYSNYTNSREEYEARKEGFTKAVRLGFRFSAGANFLFLNEKAAPWGLGFDIGGGAVAKMPLLARGLKIAPELNFSYRNFNYEETTDYSENEANIDILLFEIPVLFRYEFDEEGFFIALGPSLALKLASFSEFHQTSTINDPEIAEEEKRKNTLPTAGVQVGASLNFGYNITSNMSVDIRATQYFTNLLNKNVIAETAVMGANLWPTHIAIGFTLFL